MTMSGLAFSFWLPQGMNYIGVAINLSDVGQQNLSVERLCLAKGAGWVTKFEPFFHAANRSTIGSSQALSDIS